MISDEPWDQLRDRLEGMGLGNEVVDSLLRQTDDMDLEAVKAGRAEVSFLVSFRAVEPPAGSHEEQSEWRPSLIPVVGRGYLIGPYDPS